YCRDDCLLVLQDSEALANSAEIMGGEYRELFERVRGQRKIAAAPEMILNDFTRVVSDFPYRIDFSSEFKQQAGHTQISFPSDPPRSFFGNISYFKQELEGMLQAGYEVFIFAGYAAQTERIAHLLKEYEVTVLPLSVSAGFCIPDLKIMVIKENEIFRRKMRAAAAMQRYKTEPVESFIDLEQGDYIVHLQHGIGIYCGIERISARGFERDYIKLEYAEKEFIFIPTEQVNLIQRYVAVGGRKPKLDKIGGKAWSTRKQKVKDSVEDLAGSLLHLYSERKAKQGISFEQDSEWQNEFEAGFEFEETKDQLACIREVKRDMESPYPMERLICGDVGYGKTEIALRAAFKAVMGGRQVALLAPTTILAEQHYETFSERFKGCPVEIQMLSRF
ncbi:MAG: CarD family transcriptional regulator, partial [Spirochaetia bacterium]